MQFNNKKYANPQGGWSQQELNHALVLSFSKVQISRLPHSRMTPLTRQTDKQVTVQVQIKSGSHKWFHH